MELYKRLGLRVKQNRISLGWSQEHLAEVSSISQSFIGLIERGTKRLSVDTLVKVANALGVNTDYLLRDSIDYDISGSIDTTTSLISDMDENEIKYINEMINVTRKIMYKDRLDKNSLPE